MLRAVARAEESNTGRILRPALIALTVYHLAVGLYMAFAPSSFYDQIGPFGARNDHYIRDVSTFYIAFGIATALALSRPSWRAPVLALMAIEYALHALNHLIDIGDADPSWVGYFDFVSIALIAVVLAWLTRLAAREPAAPG
jgi:uncharacterized membrane protein